MLASKQSFCNTAVILNSSPVGLPAWFTSQNLEWIGTDLMVGYHLYYGSPIFAHLGDANQLSYLVTPQQGRTIKLGNCPGDIERRVKLMEPFCDVTESITFDIAAISRMTALVYYFMHERGVLKELNEYDGLWTHLWDAIIAHHSAQERISPVLQSQKPLSLHLQPRRHCVLSDRIFLDRLPDDQRSASIETVPQSSKPPFVSVLTLSPISTIATSSKHPRDYSDEAEESPAKRMQTDSTQSYPGNCAANHLEIMRSYAEKLLAECDQFAHEKAAYETQIQTTNTLNSELEAIVTSHTATIAAMQTSLNDANQKHAAELEAHAEKLKMFHVDTKALNGRVNELMAANQHMLQERDRVEKYHEEILHEETAKAEKVARAKLYEEIGHEMLILAKDEASELEEE